MHTHTHTHRQTDIVVHIYIYYYTVYVRRVLSPLNVSMYFIWDRQSSHSLGTVWQCALDKQSLDLMKRKISASDLHGGAPDARLMTFKSISRTGEPARQNRLHRGNKASGKAARGQRANEVQDVCSGHWNQFISQQALFNVLVIALHDVVRPSLDNPGGVNHNHFTTQHTGYISWHI